MGSRVEVVFDPFDLESVEIRFQGRSMGQGLPVSIGRHSHPQARKEAAPAPAPTGIDYLALLAERREAELARSINYAQLRLDGTEGRRSDTPSTITTNDNTTNGQGEPAMTIDRLRLALGLYPHALSKDLAPSMLHAHRSHAEAAARITWCIDERVMGVVTGEVGAGKTVAVRGALAGIDASRHTVIYLGNPTVGLRGLYSSIVSTLGGIPRFHRASLIPQAQDALATEEHERGRRVVLVLDEAHLLDAEQLEGLRLLSGADMDSHAPFACLLVGQPTLRRRIRLGAFAALDQRVALRYAMTGMEAAETADYVVHHLKIAGRTRHLVLRRCPGSHPPGLPGAAPGGQQPGRPVPGGCLRRVKGDRRRVLGAGCCHRGDGGVGRGLHSRRQPDHHGTADDDQGDSTFTNTCSRSVSASCSSNVAGDNGRRMYETMVHWETVQALADEPPCVRDFTELWQAADNIVYSKSLETVSSAKTRIDRKFDPRVIQEMKSSHERDITVGGPNLAAQAFKAGLVDECQLFLTPIVVGGGKPSLPSNVHLDLELLSERRFRSGVVFLHYRTSMADSEHPRCRADVRSASPHLSFAGRGVGTRLPARDGDTPLQASRAAMTTCWWCHDDADSIANEFQCQPGNDEGCQKDRQESLSGASERDYLALGGVEDFSAARLSAIADLQGMTSRPDWYLDRVVHFDRSDPLTVDRNIVRATTDLRSDCLMRQLQRCRHPLIPS